MVTWNNDRSLKNTYRWRHFLAGLQNNEATGPLDTVWVSSYHRSGGRKGVAPRQLLTKHRGTTCARITPGWTRYSTELGPPEPMLSSQTSFPKPPNRTADMINGANSKQGTSQKGSCGNWVIRWAPCAEKTAFPKTVNWFRCFPRLLWLRSFTRERWENDKAFLFTFAKKMVKQWSNS